MRIAKDLPDKIIHGAASDARGGECGSRPLPPGAPGQLREAGPGEPAALRDSRLGAISFPQRFGSSLNPRYHSHVLTLDGVVFGDMEHGVRFCEATGLEARDAEALARSGSLATARADP